MSVAKTKPVRRGSVTSKDRLFKKMYTPLHNRKPSRRQNAHNISNSGRTDVHRHHFATKKNSVAALDLPKRTLFQKSPRVRQHLNASTDNRFTTNLISPIFNPKKKEKTKKLGKAKEKKKQWNQEYLSKFLSKKPVTKDEKPTEESLVSNGDQGLLELSNRIRRK